MKILTLALALASVANAHELTHRIERSRAIAVQAQYADGTPLAYAAYELFSPQDARIPFQTGRSDREGWVSFVPTSEGVWRLHLADTQGHALTLDIPADTPPKRDGLSFALRPLLGLALLALLFGGFALWKKRREAVASALLALVAPLTADAHHGGTSLGIFGASGPGAALDATTAMPLGENTVIVLVRSEFAPYQQFDGFTHPKQYALFNTVILGAGLTPYLSMYLLQPVNVKSQFGTGINVGGGDSTLMMHLALKIDRGLRFTPQRESLDDLEDWHFGIMLATTFPVGPTDARDKLGSPYTPDMQMGFGAPSPTVGLSMLKYFPTRVTLQAEVSFRYFPTSSYPALGVHYQFGHETRVGAAVPIRLWSTFQKRIDLIPELSALFLARDREEDILLDSSGGNILYGALGLRATIHSFSIGLSVKRALGAWLNERQQGAEGLEILRASLVLGYAFRP